MRRRLLAALLALSGCGLPPSWLGTFSGQIRQTARQSAPLSQVSFESRMVDETWVISQPLETLVEIDRLRDGERLCHLEAGMREDGSLEIHPGQPCAVAGRTLKLEWGDVDPRTSRVQPHLVWTWSESNGEAGSITETGALTAHR